MSHYTVWKAPDNRVHRGGGRQLHCGGGRQLHRGGGRQLLHQLNSRIYCVINIYLKIHLY